MVPAGCHHVRAKAAGRKFGLASKLLRYAYQDRVREAEHRQNRSGMRPLTPGGTCKFKQVFDTQHQGPITFMEPGFWDARNEVTWKTLTQSAL